MSDAVPRLSAALEGRYTIERKLGEGGMATEGPGSALILVQNWFEELKRRVPN